MTTTNTEQLKLKLKLKRVWRQIDELVAENFGYCPSDPQFNRIWSEMKQLMDTAKTEHPDVYAHYDR